MGYSLERKAAVLTRMLPPNNLAVRRLSQQERISEATLHKWRAEARGKGQLLPDADAGPEGWTSRDKFAAGCCQTNANSSQFSQTDPVSGCAKLTPLGERGGAVGLEILSAVETALKVEMVEDRACVFHGRWAPIPRDHRQPFHAKVGS